MSGLATDRLLVLPTRSSRDASPAWSAERWFDSEDHRLRLDSQCRDALIATSIGEHKCPTIGEWTAFAVAGSVIAALTGPYIVPPNPEPHDWTNRMEDRVWEALWTAT